MEHNEAAAEQRVADKVASIERQLDILKLAIKDPVPWYRNISTIVSGLALLFSFGTTFVSYERTKSQDVHALRAELRTILQRLAALPKDDFKQKYAVNPQAVNFLSGYINQENALLARQAGEIVRKLPKEQVSATELLAIGQALQASYNIEAAQALLAQAIETSKELNDEVSALRIYANIMFVTGKPSEGRKFYQKALDLFSRYPNYGEFVKASTHVWTELSWAGSEANSGQTELASQRITSAEQHASRLLPGPGKDMLQSQIAQARTQLQTGAKIIATPPSSN